MIWIETILFSYFFLLIFFLLILIVVFTLLKKTINIHLVYTPLVSVLLAVRNEEENIIACLNALDNMDYPKDRIEILIGDDLSDDSTNSIIQNYISDKTNFKIFPITKKLGLAGAKGNVLAHLAHEAKGEFFFITDADVKVPPTWIKGLLSEWKEGIATVSGSAIIETKNFLSAFQAIDWITAFGMIHTASQTGIHVTAVGNNMMVKRDAYFQTGGYENIPFSVTEDFDLHESLRKLGWKNKNLLNPFILTRTQPIPGFFNILQQRKRWMAGAVRLSGLLVFLLSLQALFFPMLIVGFFINIKFTLLVWGVKVFLQNIYLAMVLKRVGQGIDLLKYFLVYELYSGICSALLMVYYFLPLKTNWKGRKYA